jgi:DNA-binding SARP family transcriptional activator/TolB-like protein
MIGSVDLRGPDGVEIRSLLSQPKRFALLAYLAASPAHFHRRDSLLPLFWPESSEEAARASLRTALSMLRRSLGEAAIRTRASDEVGVDPELLWSDVTAFEQACGVGEWGAALEIYGGDFLPAFHIDDSPGFERWVELRRAELRSRAAEAAWKLVESEERAGNCAEAVAWARRATTLLPDDEEGVRRLIVLLDRAGDRAGALRAFEDFADRLREQYDAEPSPETQAVIRSVCARTPATGQPEVRIVGEESPLAPELESSAADPVTEPVPAPAANPPSRIAQPGRSALLRGAGPRLVVLGAVLILAVAITSLVLAPVEAPTPVVQRVAVLPFENRTGDASLEPLGTMAADWISQGLTRTGLLEVVPITSVLYAVQGTSVTRSADTLERARQLVHQTGATVLVSGAFYGSADSLHFHTRIVDARTGTVLTGLDPVSGRRGEPLATVESLRSRVTGSLAARYDWRLERVQSDAGAPPSWEAYHESIQGIQAFIDLRYGDARTHFRRALALDSLYAPGAIFAAVNHTNVSEWAQADSLARDLTARRHRLAPSDQHILDWLVAYIHGDRPGALRAIRQAVTLVPSSEWHFVVGLAALQANHPAETIATYAKPDAQRGWAGQWLPYWDTLSEAHHVLGEHVEELEVARRARQLYPQSILAARMELRALAALGRTAAVEDLMVAVETMRPEAGVTAGGTMIRAVQDLRAHGHADASRAAAERTLAWFAARPEQERRTAAHRFAFATALYEADRSQQAQELLTRLHLEQPENVGFRGLLGVVAVRNGDGATASAASEWLAQLDPAYQRWTPILWRARISAAGGDEADALSLLTQAFASGLMYGDRIHIDTALQPLRSHAVFQRLLAPRG